MSEPQLTHPISLEERLMEGLDTLNVSYGEQAIERLIQYMELLAEWNKTHNLTSVDDPQDMITVHILDSASIKPYIKGASLLDVGSGGGLPGLILSILSPALEVVSIDSRNKKAQFQMYAANKLRLDNFTVENKRVEEYQPRDLFPLITARAFSDIETLINTSKHCIAPNGKWLVMKGAVNQADIKALDKLRYDADTFALKVPSLEAQRNLIVVQANKK